MTDCRHSKICLLFNFRIVIFALHDFGVIKSAATPVDCNLLFIYYRAWANARCPNIRTHGSTLSGDVITDEPTESDVDAIIFSIKNYYGGAERECAIAI